MITVLWTLDKGTLGCNGNTLLVLFSASCKLSQCTSLKTHSIVQRFGVLLRPSSGSVIQNSTKMTRGEVAYIKA